MVASRLIDGDKSKYDWVAMLNGLDHLYMNQMKTFFNIARDIIREPLDKDVLHFESPTTTQHFFKCSDTLKTYHSLEIFFYGTTLEMIHTYVNECQDQPTVEGFLSWNLNNTYHVVHQLLLKFALAIIITKPGVTITM